MAKQILKQKLNDEQLQQQLEHLLNAKTPCEVRAYLRKFGKELYPTNEGILYACILKKIGTKVIYGYLTYLCGEAKLQDVFVANYDVDVSNQQTVCV